MVYDPAAFHLPGDIIHSSAFLISDSYKDSLTSLLSSVMWSAAEDARLLWGEALTADSGRGSRTESSLQYALRFSVT